MHTFEVWAPDARTMDVKIGEQKFSLTKGHRGWWSGSVDIAGPNTDYLFIIDGQEPGVPDPRSPWQPNGVHGPSRIFDPAEFSDIWTDAEWQAPPFESAIFYELHIGTFTPEGTLEAAESRLAYLRELGISHVQLMPVATFPGDRGWGYDGVDLYAPHPAYGGPTGLQHFVNACHEKGLAVLLDVVYNHLGPAGNYLSRFAPYFTGVHCTPWGDAVNLEEPESTGVRRFFIDNALMWLRDYHFDGLRLDAVHAFIDRSAIHFLEQLASEVRALEFEMGKHFVVIAESDLNDPRLVSATQAGGFGLDAQWSDDFHHALVTVLTGERQGYYRDFGSLADLGKSLREVFVYDGKYSEYRRRNHGRPAIGLPGYRFLGYAQNHDQVGNRAKGDRLIQIAGPGRAKIAAALVVTSPFIPLLFQGEEFGASTPFQYFTSFEDPELGRSVSEGRKREFAAFVWSQDEIADPQEPETFAQSKLDWGELDQEPHRALLQWHKDLIRLRKSTGDLTNGALAAVEIRFDEEAGWFVMERGRVRVAFNLGKTQATLPCEDGAELLLASDPSVKIQGAALALGPDSVGIVSLPSAKN
jgi:maltooligosyltrehalose trehalohydrolase